MFEVRWGIIGTGAMAESFAKALACVEGAVLHGVSSRHRALSDGFAKKFGIRRAYRCCDELLADPAIDVVYVATRNECHHDDSLAVINAGKAVLCEKPFALTARQGRDVIEAARQRRVFCMEAMWMRCSPAMREVLELVRSGSIGAPRFISAQFGFAVAFNPEGRLFVPPGGGALYDLGVYPLSFVHAVCGRPTRISSGAWMGPTGVDEQVTALLEYESGCQAVIVASLRSQLLNSAAIHGRDGILNFIQPMPFPVSYQPTKTLTEKGVNRFPGDLKPALHVRAWSRATRVLLRREVSGEVVRHPMENGYSCEAAAVQRCLQAGLLESPEMPLDETLAVLESMDEIRKHWSTEK